MKILRADPLENARRLELDVADAGLISDRSAFPFEQPADDDFVAATDDGYRLQVANVITLQVSVVCSTNPRKRVVDSLAVGGEIHSRPRCWQRHDRHTIGAGERVDEFPHRHDQIAGASRRDVVLIDGDDDEAAMRPSDI